MIPLVYAILPGEVFDVATLLTDGFSGIEQNRSGSLIGDDGRLLYRLISPAQPGTSPVQMGHTLRDQAEADPSREILLENGGAFRSPRELWQVLEAANHPRVKIAWNAATGRATGHPPALVVPTLNLRLGIVRLDQMDDDTLPFARRLAGVGFAGWVVIDPPAGAAVDRREQARTISTAIKSVLKPRKPAKAVAKAK